MWILMVLKKIIQKTIRMNMNNQIAGDTINNYKRISAQLEKKQLEANRLKNINRKERASRLIQKGALLEKYFEISDLSIEDTEKLLAKFSDFVKKNK